MASKSRAIPRLFLEPTREPRNESLIPPQEGMDILAVTELQTEHLKHLTTHGPARAALRMRLLEREHARYLAARLAVARFTPYGVVRDLGFIGLPLYEARQPNQKDAYFQTASAVTSAIRTATAPFSPIDGIAGRLRNAWPPGVRTLTLDGKPCAEGVVRSLATGGAIEAHVDDPVADAGFHPDVLSIQSTMSALVYLDMPSEGGELVLWSAKLNRDEQLAARRAGSEYGLDERRLPPPSLVIHPEPGELVLFSASHPHAVRQFVSGRRITISVFVNFHGIGEPLSLHA